MAKIIEYFTNNKPFQLHKIFFAISILFLCVPPQIFSRSETLLFGNIRANNTYAFNNNILILFRYSSTDRMIFFAFF